VSPTDSLPVLRYILHGDRGIPGNDEVLYNSSAVNVFTYTHIGLTPGTLYSYWLQVENFNGLSSQPGSLVERLACAPPNYFSSLEVVGQSSTTVSLEWAEPLISTGCPITGYSVLADDGNRGTLAAIDLTDSAALLSATTYTFIVGSEATHSLVVGLEHRFAIIAYSSVG